MISLAANRLIGLRTLLSDIIAGITVQEDILRRISAAILLTGR